MNFLYTLGAMLLYVCKNMMKCDLKILTDVSKFMLCRLCRCEICHGFNFDMQVFKILRIDWL